MKHGKTSEHQSIRRILRSACATALAVAGTVALPQPAHAHHVTPPPVPANIDVQQGNKAFLVGHAVGTQNYVCLPSGTGVKFVLFTPEATLFKFEDNTKQLITHYFSPNLNPTDPDETKDTIRATWQDSKDTSTVWAKAIASSSDSGFVAPGAIPWVLLQVVGAEDGPTGGDELSETTYIQRLNTVGGLAPSTPCTVGMMALVPYTADYFFYKAIKRTSSR